MKLYLAKGKIKLRQETFNNQSQDDKEKNTVKTS